MKLGWVDGLPAIVKVLLVFGGVLLLIKRRWSLGNAFLAGAAGLGLIFGMTPPAILRSAVAALLNASAVSLSIVVALILIFSHTLEKSGQMARLLENFKGLIRWPKVNMVIFPALIGLLPMPGGAIFSAPMVKNLGADHPLSAAQLSYINYWFRHIWEYWWPLYPGILLTTALAQVDLWRLVLYTAPLTAVAVAAGYWPLRGAMQAARTPATRKSVQPFFMELAPILCVIVLGLACGSILSNIWPPAMQSVAKEAGLIPALLVSIFWVWRRNAVDWRHRWAIVKDPALIRMVYMIAGILLFKGILEDSQAVERVSAEMLRWNIPLMPITMILPFLVGSVVGITIAFVGSTFPILISLIHAMGQERLILPYLMLALASGFVGVLLSPLHLCLLLSNEYFKTSLMPIYRIMRSPLIALAAAASIYFGLLRYLNG